jgi:hypothetical protein
VRAELSGVRGSVRVQQFDDAAPIEHLDEGAGAAFELDGHLIRVQRDQRNAIFLPSRTSIVRASAGTRSIGVTTTPTNGVSGEYGWAGSPFGTECHSPIQVPYSCGSRAIYLRTRSGQPVGSSSSPVTEAIGQSAGRLEHQFGVGADVVARRDCHRQLAHPRRNQAPVRALLGWCHDVNMHADEVGGDFVVDELNRPRVFLEVSVDRIGERLLGPWCRYIAVMQWLMTQDS